MKHCKDCKYFKSAHWLLPDDVWSECTHAEFTREDPVMGELEYIKCSAARKFDRLCGPEAKYYEKRL